MDELSSIYTFIWEFINQKVSSEDDMRYILNKDVIKEAVLDDMLGSLTKKELGVYFDQLSETKINEIWHKLVDAGFINDSGRFLPNKPKKIMNDMFEGKSAVFIDRLNFIIGQNAKRSKQIYVPQHLISFVLLHLEKWIESALRALQMREDKEYIVDVDHSSGSEIHPIIIVQDLDTGTDQFNCKFLKMFNKKFLINFYFFSQLNGKIVCTSSCSSSIAASCRSKASKRCSFLTFLTSNFMSQSLECQAHSAQQMNEIN